MSDQFFDKKDLEEIVSKIESAPPYKLDIKELGRNAALGAVDVLKASVHLGIAIVENAPATTTSKNMNEQCIHEPDGYRDGHSGYGYYIYDIKS